MIPTSRVSFKDFSNLLEIDWICIFQKLEIHWNCISSIQKSIENLVPKLEIHSNSNSLIWKFTKKYISKNGISIKFEYLKQKIY